MPDSIFLHLTYIICSAAFLKNVYSVYRYSPTFAVGFAPLRRSLFDDYYPDPSLDAETTLPYVHSGAAFGPIGGKSSHPCLGLSSCNHYSTIGVCFIFRCQFGRRWIPAQRRDYISCFNIKDRHAAGSLAPHRFMSVLIRTCNFKHGQCRHLFNCPPEFCACRSALLRASEILEFERDWQ